MFFCKCLGVNLTTSTPLACQQAAEKFFYILKQIKLSRQHFVQYRYVLIFDRDKKKI